MSQSSWTACDVRRQRLLDLLAQERLDSVVITDARDIYYFMGTLIPIDLPAALVVGGDGHLLFVGPAEHDVGPIDRYLSYEWNYRGTRHPDPVAQMFSTLATAWKPSRPQRIGVQRWSLLEHVARMLEQSSSGEFVALDAQLAVMQRRKDPDEVELIRESIRANFGAYAAVEEAIWPGATELDVLSAGRRGAARVAGEKVFHDGDYQCGAYNGPARDRAIDAGELYIVDAWTCHRGYWSDMSRTFIVGRSPTDVQFALFEHVRWVQTEVCKLLRPGIDGMVVYRLMDEMIRQYPPLADIGLIHHGGHAIGLRAHELPDVNLARGGMLETANIICIEPGGYCAEARYGVRLENMYLITETGCENLCPGEMQLVQCG
jgi:Xaa-Pro aminopeptidase